MAEVLMSQGSKLYRGTMAGDGSVTYAIISNLTNFSGPNLTRNEIDVTSLHSTSREYKLGLKDNGEFTANMNVNLRDPVHRALISDLDGTDDIPFKLEFSTGDFLLFYGLVKGMPLSGAVDAVVTASLSLRITGEMKWNFRDAKAAIIWDSTLAGAADTGAVTGTYVGDLAATSLGTSEGVVPKFATGPFVSGLHYRLENVPAGLTPALTRTSDTKITLGFTGTATATEDTVDVMLHLNDSIFMGSLYASDVAGAQKIRVGITFL